MKCASNGLTKKDDTDQQKDERFDNWITTNFENKTTNVPKKQPVVRTKDRRLSHDVERMGIPTRTTVKSNKAHGPPSPYMYVTLQVPNDPPFRGFEQTTIKKDDMTDQGHHG